MRAGNSSLHTQVKLGTTIKLDYPVKDGVAELRVELAELTRELEEAVNSEDFQQAQQQKEAITGLEEQIKEIEWEWVEITEEHGGNYTDSVIMVSLMIGCNML